MNRFIFVLVALYLFSAHSASAEKMDTLYHSKDYKFQYKALIVPTLLITYGLIGIESDAIKGYNAEIKEDVRDIDDKFTLDDASQYLPFLSVYALNGLGVKGNNNFRDRTFILATSYLLMGSTVAILKNTTHVMRPDGSSDNSFPSGHTATAFMGAEFLYQEYKDVSVWYGVAGYTVAAATGFFRMYNDRHWLTDVAAGAGIGMLSTKVAYWSYPFIRRTFSIDSHKHKTETNALIMPFYNGKLIGVNLSMQF